MPNKVDRTVPLGSEALKTKRTWSLTISDNTSHDCRQAQFPSIVGNFLAPCEDLFEPAENALPGQLSIMMQSVWWTSWAAISMQQLGSQVGNQGFCLAMFHLRCSVAVQLQGHSFKLVTGSTEYFANALCLTALIHEGTSLSYGLTAHDPATEAQSPSQR
jgi:hypothetical protein